MPISDIKIPENLIAQHPLPEREKCRLLVLDRSTGTIEHRIFENVVSLFDEGDLVVFNNSKVVKARFDGIKSTGGRVELFLLRPAQEAVNSWHSLIKGKNIRSGTIIELGGSDLRVEVVSQQEDGTYVVRFEPKVDILRVMEDLGRLPLPPYIKRLPDTDDSRYYQTVFANVEGSVAAPTAALHFSQALMDRISEKGVKTGFVTLHVGYGTFSMIRDLKSHVMHEEFYSIDALLAQQIRACRDSGKRVWAVGTTVVRTLETAFGKDLSLESQAGFTSLFIRPGYEFKVVDAMITNFHHPETTLIYLVSAFAGEDNIVRSYNEAVKSGYRLLSYGDAMAII